MAEGFEDGLGQLYDPGDGAEQGQAHDKRETDSDAPGANAVFRRQLIGEDGDEDEVVDAEDDLHYNECDEGDPSLRALNKREDFLHRRLFLSGHDRSRSI